MDACKRFHLVLKVILINIYVTYCIYSIGELFILCQNLGTKFESPFFKAFNRGSKNCTELYMLLKAMTLLANYDNYVVVN